MLASIYNTPLDATGGDEVVRSARTFKRPQAICFLLLAGCINSNHTYSPDTKERIQFLVSSDLPDMR
jgi:hypothetical protein